MIRASWLCPACNTSNHVNDSRCRWCGSGRDVRRVRDLALLRALVTDPFPPTPAPLAPLPLSDEPGAGVGSPPTGPTLTDRITRDVVRALAHPATGVVLGAALVVLGSLSSALVLVLR